MTENGASSQKSKHDTIRAIASATIPSAGPASSDEVRGLKVSHQKVPHTTRPGPLADVGQEIEIRWKDGNWWKATVLGKRQPDEQQPAELHFRWAGRKKSKGAWIAVNDPTVRCTVKPPGW